MRPLDLPHRTLHLDLPEGRLQVLAAGEGGPPVLLLSGAGTDHALLSWRRLIPELAADRTVLALDWPKQGGSRPWRGRADHGVLLRCVDAALDLALDEARRSGWAGDAVDVVGLSQGGAMTLAAAIEFPERVRRIVPIAPAGTIDFPPVVHQLLWLTAKADPLVAAATRLAFRRRGAVERFVRASLIPGPVDDLDEIVDEVLEAARSGAGASDWQNASIGPLRMRVDLRPRLGGIRAPALFIQGTRDVGVPWRATEAAAAAVPGARLELVERAGHWVPRHEPDLVARLVREFLA